MVLSGEGPEPEWEPAPDEGGKRTQRRGAGLQAQVPLQAQFGPQVQGLHTHFLFCCFCI